MSDVHVVAEAFADVVDVFVQSVETDGLLTFLLQSTSLSNVNDGAVLLVGELGNLEMSVVSSGDVRQLIETSMNEGFESAEQCRVLAQPVFTEFSPSDVPFSRYVEKCLNNGFHHEYALPLSNQGDVVGVLLLLDRNESRLDPKRSEVARAMATVAATMVSQNRLVKHHRALTTQLQAALDSRVVIEQAKGVLAERHDVDVATAFQVLRQSARSQQRLLVDVAKEIIRKEDKQT